MDDCGLISGVSFFASNTSRRAKLSRQSLPFLLIGELSHRNLRMRLLIHIEIRDQRTDVIDFRALFESSTHHWIRTACLSAHSGVIVWSATTFHSRTLLVTRICIKVLVPSQLPVLQPDHRPTKVQNFSPHTTLCPILVSWDVVSQSVRRSLQFSCQQDARLSSSIVPSKCPDPSMNPVCPPGLQTTSPKLRNRLWNLLMVNSSKGVLPLDRTTNLFLRKL